MFKRLREDIEVVLNRIQRQEVISKSFDLLWITCSLAHRIAHAFYKRISSLLHVGSHKLVVSLLALRFIQEQQLVVVFH